MRAGVPYRWLALPGIATAEGLSRVEWLCLEAWLRGQKGTGLVDHVGEALRDLGAGEELDAATPQPRGGAVAQACGLFEQRTLPRLQRLGAVAAQPAT